MKQQSLLLKDYINNEGFKFNKYNYSNHTIEKTKTLK